MNRYARSFVFVAATLASSWGLAQCPPTVPVANGAVPGPLPLFPADNW